MSISARKRWDEDSLLNDGILFFLFVRTHTILLIVSKETCTFRLTTKPLNVIAFLTLIYYSVPLMFMCCLFPFWRLVNTHTQNRDNISSTYIIFAPSRNGTHCAVRQFHGKMQYCYLFWFATIFRIWWMQPNGGIVIAARMNSMHSITTVLSLRMRRGKKMPQCVRLESFGMWAELVCKRNWKLEEEKQQQTKQKKGARVTTTKKLYI